MYMSHIFFIHLPVGGRLGGFQVWLPWAVLPWTQGACVLSDPVSSVSPGALNPIRGRNGETSWSLSWVRKQNSHILQVFWRLRCWFKQHQHHKQASTVAQMVKNPPVNAGDTGSIPELERSPGEGNSNTLQCSCLENPMDRGTWWAKVHGVAKSWTRLSGFTFTFSIINY